MKKVTLLGDSIRQLGYGTKVPALLGEAYDVFQPDDNCRFAKYTLRGLYDWKAQMAGSEVIHWNNGLWDVCDLFGDGLFTPVEEYRANILRIARLLLQTAPHVIFATTTPVLDGHPCNDNADIRRYNAAVVPDLQKMGVAINDLHAAVFPDRTRYIRSDDMIHLTEEGISLCAGLVAEKIREAAEQTA